MNGTHHARIEKIVNLFSREIFSDPADFNRFLQSMQEFNVADPIGSIYEHCRVKVNSNFGSSTSKIGKNKDSEPLVNIVAYCLNTNHYHFLLQQLSEKGIEKFMQRLGTGYTMYFNNKYHRTGALFQGRFKAVHINTNQYLLHVSAYVNLNDRVHQLGGSTSKSSWNEYTERLGTGGICGKEAVLGQFRKPEEYAVFAEDSLQGTLARRGLLDESMLLES